jgi:hypothetical protein
MPRLIAVSYALLLSTLPLMAAGAENQFDPDRVPPLSAVTVPSACVGLRDAKLAYCLALQLERPASCRGTLGERLTCLEQRLAKQQRQIAELERLLHDLTSPRIRPLTQQ